MGLPSDNQTWLIDEGHEVITKKAERGIENLSDRERLIYCLWVADYGVRNAGDLETASDLYPPFQKEAAELAAKLWLGFVAESFSLPGPLLEQQYFERFERICDDLRQVRDQA